MSTTEGNPVTNLSDYMSRTRGLPADHLVGTLIWYSISSRVNRDEHGRSHGRIPIRATVAQFEDWFKELGIDEKYLPSQISKINAFRKASSVARCEYAIGEKQTVKLRVEEVHSSDEKVVRHVFRDLTDTRRQVQVSAKVASLQFYRGARTSTGKTVEAQQFKTRVLTKMVLVGLDGVETGEKQDLPPFEHVEIQGFVNDIKLKYEDMCIFLDSNAIRTIIRIAVTDLNAIPCKEGGSLYFIHTTKQDKVDALQELVRRVGQGCQFIQVPLLDTSDARDMLTEAFQTEVEEQCYLLIKEISDTNEALKAKDGTVTSRLYARLKSRYDEIVKRSEEYTKILGLSQGRSASALELALEGVFDIAERIEA